MCVYIRACMSVQYVHNYINIFNQLLVCIMHCMDALSTTGFQYLIDVEEHLGVTVPETDCSMKVETNEFDGKVIYGEKRSNKGKSRRDFTQSSVLCD